MGITRITAVASSVATLCIGLLVGCSSSDQSSTSNDSPSTQTQSGPNTDPHAGWVNVFEDDYGYMIRKRCDGPNMLYQNPNRQGGAMTVSTNDLACIPAHP
jgi:hypothetical protein